MNTMTEAFLRKRKQIFLLCWLAYACVYLCRVNLSIALPYLESELAISKAQQGLLGSVFFWSYGVGHLINGALGDRLRAKGMIAIGLCITLAANIAFGLSSSYGLLLFYWGLNGWFQSMLWGPIARTMSLWYEPERRGGIIIAASTSMVGGYLIAWLLSGQLASYFGWRYVFIVPGAVTLVFVLLWIAFFRNRPEEQGFPAVARSFPDDLPSANPTKTGDAADAGKPLTLPQVLIKTRIWFVVVACFAQGIVKDGIGLWGPVFFMDTQGLDIKRTASLVIFIPIMNFAGMMLAARLHKRFPDKLGICTGFMFLAGVLLTTALLLFGKSNLYLSLFLLGSASGVMYGANTLLLGVFPMRYAKYGKVSSVAGFLDFSSYVSSGVAAVFSGFMVSLFGWNGLVVIWVFVALLGMLALLVESIQDKANAKTEVY